MNAILATIRGTSILGVDNDLPWNNGLQETKRCAITKLDMQMFKYITHKSNVVIGKNTWLSIHSKPLKDRNTHFVLTSNPERMKSKYPNVIFLTMDDFKKNYMLQTPNLWCLGGAKIYNELLPYCEQIYWNELDFSYDEQKILNHLSTNFSKEQIAKVKDTPITFCKKFNFLLASTSEISLNGYSLVSNLLIKNHLHGFKY